jgi:hypothetical protein
MTTLVRMMGPKQRWGRAAYYFARAKVARTMLDSMKSVSARQAMERIAECWERMGKLEEMSTMAINKPVDQDGDTRRFY